MEGPIDYIIDLEYGTFLSGYGGANRLLDLESGPFLSGYGGGGGGGQ